MVRLVLVFFVKKMTNKFNQISFKTHNLQYENENCFEKEKKAWERKELSNYIELYKSDHAQGRDLDTFSWLRHAVDVGSGTGWFSSYLVRKRGYKKVYAIEPSKSAVEISKVLHPNLNSIEWINGFAEEEIPRLNLTEPTFFSFMCVLSHMPDDLALSICDAIYENSPVGSVISFSENWGSASSDIENCWHSREPRWWVDQFKGWHLKFHTDYAHGNQLYKGLTAFKY